MKTVVLPVGEDALAEAARLIRAGEIVAFPTETVYGLGANALDGAAVLKIFEAKGRPADNPLIAHIAHPDALSLLARRVPERARALMRAFWPGPLTLICEKKDAVPAEVSAGRSTVAVRMPSHPAAAALLRAAGVPVAAPSANRSGRPSPTAAAHVLEDMDGRIPLILDGGPCGVGVESTVVDMTGAHPLLLRPGGVTPEMLRTLAPDLAIDPAVLHPLAPGAQARSPGMKYRHYAPRARVTVVTGGADRLCARYDAALAAGETPAILCANAAPYAARRTLPLGADAGAMAAHLFGALRDADAQGVTRIFAEPVGAEGMGLALMNRLLRAAGFDVE